MIGSNGSQSAFMVGQPVNSIFFYGKNAAKQAVVINGNVLETGYVGVPDDIIHAVHIDNRRIQQADMIVLLVSKLDTLKSAGGCGFPWFKSDSAV